MNKNRAVFEKNLKKAGVSDEVIEQIIDTPYQQSDDEKQDNANYCAAVMSKCDMLLDFYTIGEVMYNRACCKSGFRLNNARMIAREHGDKSIEDKLQLLGQQQWMGKPRLTENGDIETGYCAGGSGDGVYTALAGALVTAAQLEERCLRLTACAAAGISGFITKKRSGLSCASKK